MKPLVIGITGGSGSGKTLFINKLRKRFGDEEICLISQDDYYCPKEEQKIDDHGVVNYDRPKSIDKEGFLDDIKLLLKGQVVQRPEYTFNNDKIIPKMLTFRPAPILLVEGLFVFHFKKIRRILDLKVFLHAKENLKVIRRIKRDKIERNYPLDDVLYRYQHHVLPAFEKYIEPYSEEADIVINNNDNFEMGLNVLSGYLKQYLEEHPYK
jgi:uridine kinase